MKEVEFTIDDDILLFCALEAHKRDITLNQYINEILNNYINELKLI